MAQMTALPYLWCCTLGGDPPDACWMSIAGGGWCTVRSWCTRLVRRRRRRRFLSVALIWVWRPLVFVASMPGGGDRGLRRTSGAAGLPTAHSLSCHFCTISTHHSVVWCSSMQRHSTVPCSHGGPKPDRDTHTWQISRAGYSRTGGCYDEMSDSSERTSTCANRSVTTVSHDSRQKQRARCPSQWWSCMVPPHSHPAAARVP